MENSLKIILKQKKLKQVVLAENVDVVPQSISKWVRRDQKIPQEKIARLSTILEVPSRYFVDERGFGFERLGSHAFVFYRIETR